MLKSSGYPVYVWLFKLKIYTLGYKTYTCFCQTVRSWISINSWRFVQLKSYLFCKSKFEIYNKKYCSNLKLRLFSLQKPLHYILSGKHTSYTKYNLMWFVCFCYYTKFNKKKISW